MRLSLYQSIKDWIDGEPHIHAAVLFGSSAAKPLGNEEINEGADFDIHIVTSRPAEIAKLDWATKLPGQKYLMQCLRPATGGVQKLTVLFATGQLDLILIPVNQLRLARMGLALGMERYNAQLRVALNEINTCIHGGHRMLKGDRSWGGFYAKVSSHMPGVRLNKEEIIELADRALVDRLWIEQKIRRGELCAAQHVLHRSLAETNFRLLRELRMRKEVPLPSFGLGRHVEKLLAPTELVMVRVNARCEAAALTAATQQAFDGLVAPDAPTGADVETTHYRGDQQ
jgi:hypothetical protein